jgi:hypothetical protein
MSTNSLYGGRSVTYGDLFGPQPGTYGDYLAGGKPGSHPKHPPHKVWCGPARAPVLAFHGTARYHVVIPLTSRRPAGVVATVLPTPAARWNDEQDLADILRLLKLVP